MTITATKPDLDMCLTLDESNGFIAGVKAVTTSASTDPVRGILNNVLINVKDGEVKLVATNSYMLTVVTLGPYLNMPEDVDVEFMVNAKQLKAAMPTGTKNQLTLLVENSGLVISTENSTAGMVFEDGTFPQWQNLGAGITVETNGAGVDFKVNPKLMAQLAKQAEIFRGRNDESPIYFKAAEANVKDNRAPAMKPIHMTCTVIDRGTWYGLLMPVR